MTLKHCRSCASSSVELLIERHDFPLYIWPLSIEHVTQLRDLQLFVCLDCGHLQLQDMDEQTIFEIYRDEAFNLENEAQNRFRLKKITQDISNKFHKTKVLEIGGGRNSLVSFLPDTCSKWVADFDVDRDVVDNLDGFFEGDFISIDINQSEFDFIFLFHVLEHFNSPGLALDKIRELLSKNGSVYIEVPNFLYESAVIPYYALFHMHISLFTKCSLANMLAQHGFKCERFISADDCLFAEFIVGVSDDECDCLADSMAGVGVLKANVEKYRDKLAKVFDGLPEGKVAIFGGGGSTSLFLYNFPFLVNKISYAIDNDVRKYGKHLCGGSLPIIEESMIGKKGVEYVVVLEREHVEYVSNADVTFINVKEIVS